MARTSLLLAALLIISLLTFWRTLESHTVELQIVHDIHQPASEIHEHKPDSKVAKVSVAINDLSTGIVAGALRSHKVQNEMHGYQHFVLTKALVEEEEDPDGRPLGTWSKPTYLLTLMLKEMEKPAHERLKWLYWFDADTVIVNPHIRLETFLPPADQILDTSHLLLTENWDGINAGVFPIRVSSWSINLLSAWASYSSIHPDEFLYFRDQTALWHLLDQNQHFKSNYSIVPHRWFNSFPINSAFDSNGTWIYATAMTPDEFDHGDAIHDLQPWKILKGDMVVHFAGAKQRMSWMEPWLERTQMYLPQWSSSVYQKTRTQEAEAFWRQEKLNMKERQEEQHRQRVAEKDRADRERADRERIEKERTEKESREGDNKGENRGQDNREDDHRDGIDRGRDNREEDNRDGEHRDGEHRDEVDRGDDRGRDEYRAEA